MAERSLEKILLDAVALAFPPGGISDLTRKISGCFEQSVDAYDGDVRIRDADRKALIGLVRFALINTVMVNFANEHPTHVRFEEKMEGTEGENNHVELLVGDHFLITAHHHTKSDSMPEDFVNVGSTYAQNHTKINEYCDDEWFTEKRIVKFPRERLLYMMILHQKSPEGLRQLGNIEFVLPKKSKKFIILSVTDLVRRQSEIEEMSSEDLAHFKLRTSGEIRKYIA